MKVWHVAIMALLGFLIVVLAFNLLDRDAFDGGSLTPPQDSSDPIAARLLPETVTHSCPTCGECVHPVQIVESRRALTLVNHRPWYKLFWATDQTVYFEEPVYLAACLQNRAARDPKGEWTINAQIGPARPARVGPHDCGKIPVRLSIRYHLLRSETPIVESTSDFDPPFRVAASVRTLAYAYNHPRMPGILYFGWELGKNAFDAVSAREPCPCGTASQR